MDVADTVHKEIIGIGAGIQGLSTAVALQEEFEGTGVHFRIVEAKDAAGKGLTNRPGWATIGTMHSGGTFVPDTLRAQVCADFYKWLRQDPAKDNRVMKVFRRNTFDPNDPKISGAKLFVARNAPGGIENLVQISENLKTAGVKFEWIWNEDEIAALKEPIADPKETVAVLRLTESVVLDIPGAIEDLRQEFIAHNGIIDYSVRAVDFKVPRNGMSDTVVNCEKDGEKFSYAAVAVVNIAGFDSGPLARKASAALNESKRRNLGANVTAPAVSEEEYFNDIFALVHKKGEGPAIMHLTYVGNNAVLGGAAAQATVGAHTFMSIRNADGTYTSFIGPFNFTRTRETLGNLTDPKLLAEMESRRETIIKQAKNVLPNFNPDDWELKHVGSECSAVDANGNSIYEIIDCDDPRVGYKVISRRTQYTPGLTGAPSLAYRTAHELRNWYDERLRRAELHDKFKQRFGDIKPTSQIRLTRFQLNSIAKKIGVPLRAGSSAKENQPLLRKIKHGTAFVKPEFDLYPIGKRNVPRRRDQTLKSRVMHHSIVQAILSGELKTGTKIYVDSAGSTGEAAVFFTATNQGEERIFQSAILTTAATEYWQSRASHQLLAGATVILTPPEQGAIAPVALCYEGVAAAVERGESAWALDQFVSKWNPEAQKTTGREIRRDTGGMGISPNNGKLYVIAGAGSFGTAKGIAWALNNRANAVVIAVEALEAAIAAGMTPASHDTYGTSPRFLAKQFDPRLVISGKIILGQSLAARSRQVAAAVERTVRAYSGKTAVTLPDGSIGYTLEYVGLDIGPSGGAVTSQLLRRMRDPDSKPNARYVALLADGMFVHKPSGAENIKPYIKAAGAIPVRHVKARFMKIAEERATVKRPPMGTALQRRLEHRYGHGRPRKAWGLKND